MGEEKFPGFSCLKLKNGIYIYCQMVYDNHEQSKVFRVKCRRDGELYGGRRLCAYDGRSAPAVAYWWLTSFM